MNVHPPQATELIDMASTLHYDLDAALAEVAPGQTDVASLSPAELAAVHAHFQAQQRTRDQATSAAFRRQSPAEQEAELKSLFGV